MRSIRFVLSALALWAGTASAAEDKAPDKTLSPYFFVENGDPSVDSLPLEKTSVDVAVSGVIADVTVTQVYKNDGKRPINARYVFPASTRAAVHGLKMIVGDQVVEAQIKRREDARKDFEKAKEEGKNASLLEQERPNVFTMELANIMPGDHISVELKYSELIVPTDGVYELVYPTVVGPRYSNEKAADAPGSDKWIHSPYLAAPPTYAFALKGSLAAGMPIQAMSSPSHHITTQWSPDAQQVDLALDPSEAHGGDRDFILRYKLAGGAINSGLLLYQGEKESFFLLMAQPPGRVTPQDIPPREYVFILDVSGSMEGFPLDTAKQLISDLVSHLRPTDSFDVILFSGGSTVMSPRSLPATADNVKMAIEVIDRQRGGGGTELKPALEQALALPREEGRSRSIVVVTDGYVGAEGDMFQTIQDHLGDANLFAFGIGSSVNRYLIEGMARAGMGEPFVVVGPGQTREAAERFRKYIESPVLTRVKLETKGFDVYDVEPGNLPDVLADRPVIVQGKWRGDKKGTIKLSGVSGRGPWTQSIDVAGVKTQDANRALPILWARTRIANISDLAFGNETDEQKEQIVAIGLTYSLLTKHTSFIAVRHLVRNGQGATDVNQPLPLPQGVSELAVPTEAGDEPSLALIALALALVGAAAWFVRKTEALNQC